MLRQMHQEEQPDLIIGSSMGGMYTEMLYGTDRILVNPAFQMGETMGKHGMIGKQTFQNPRKDGVQEFIVTKAMVKEYEEMTSHCFAHAADEGEQQRVYGLFGDEDPLVHTFPLFSEHYANAKDASAPSCSSTSTPFTTAITTPPPACTRLMRCS